MLKKVNVVIIAVILLVLNMSYAEEKVKVFGGKNGWPHLEKMDGVVIGKGQYGYDAVVLATNSRPVDKDTDLLLNFEGKEIRDLAGKYTVSSNKITVSDNSCMGKKAGLVRGNGGITLKGNRSTIFGSSGAVGSFLIEFWLRPSIAENGEIVFSWRSSRTVANYPLYQMISASFSGNHLEWAFTNVFNGYTENNGEIKLSSYTTIIPDVWMHHSISFDQNTGLLEYRINGQLEALEFITTNGHEKGGSIYEPQIGVPADIDICSHYTGLVDDFRIQRNSESEIAENLRHDNYKTEGGRFVTEPILLSYGSRLKKLDAIVKTPSQTDVEFYVRSGDNYFNWTDDSPEWIPVKNHQEIKDVKGLYFQVAADLYPDGNGAKTPSVTEVKLTYTEIPSPIAPFYLNASAQDGEVVLTWPYSVDESVGGYYVFYGERPGEYLGRTAVEGTSPINVGNVTSATISGLKNGKVYYFAVASYSKYDDKIMGELSKEVFARPLKNRK